jgi:hypothetical protein
MLASTRSSSEALLVIGVVLFCHSYMFNFTNLINIVCLDRTQDATLGAFLLYALRGRYKDMLCKSHTSAVSTPPKFLPLLTKEEIHSKYNKLLPTAENESPSQHAILI